eukprot:CAMPEP_0201594382 /NCGR_PEP_ID=MMETSP0190_2-20130828/191710_1 /ASSEMBLY_ACC=CAM_ASM_000263 /TAXON_ID=37353 /ORGANISM="Rosalina sp." /LENGTH=284 /DNA_ID=CAMNT_0048053965 /DNA_START=494 /DNA_END=1348 /DNA_ORIENTATION=-
MAVRGGYCESNNPGQKFKAMCAKLKLPVECLKLKDNKGHAVCHWKEDAANLSKCIEQQEAKKWEDAQAQSRKVFNDHIQKKDKLQFEFQQEMKAIKIPQEYTNNVIKCVNKIEEKAKPNPNPKKCGNCVILARQIDDNLYQDEPSGIISNQYGIAGDGYHMISNREYHGYGSYDYYNPDSVIIFAMTGIIFIGCCCMFIIISIIAGFISGKFYEMSGSYDYYNPDSVIIFAMTSIVFIGCCCMFIIISIIAGFISGKFYEMRNNTKSKSNRYKYDEISVNEQRV